MAQFNFGSNASTAATPNYSFGAKPPAPAFGTLGAPQQQPAGSITFGTPIASIAPTPQPAGLNFGSPAPTLNFGTPANTAPATGLAFGTPKTTAGYGFGNTAPNTQSFGFGAGATTTSTGYTLGTPSTVAGLSFGTPAGSALATGLAFGTPAPTTATPTLNFGAPTPAANTAFTLGLPTTSTTGLFGTATVTPTPAGNLNFGATAIATPAPAGNLNFGATAPVTPAPAGNLSFGATATVTPTPAGNLGFGATATVTPTPAGSLGFGATATATPAPASGLGFGSTPTATPAPAGNLSFGATATATPTPSGGLGFSATTTTGFTLGTNTPSTGLNFGAPPTTSATGLFAASTFATPSTAALPNFSFGGAKSTITPTPTLGAVTTTTSVGLGGVDSTLAKSGAPAAGSANIIAAKENQVPNEILQTLETFKQFVKDQKIHSSDVSRGSARPFLKVGEDIDLLSTALSEVGNELQRNYQVATKLKNDSARCLHNAEMAQRTYDTPPGLQFENTAPLQYFIDLVNKFEQDLQAIRIQIDVTDKHIQSLQEPRFLSSQELSVGMRRLHDTFVALAGRLQSVHSQVESQKEQYLNLRKYILKDPTDIFIQPPIKEPVLVSNVSNIKGHLISGPTPFSTIGTANIPVMPTAQQVPNKPPPAYPATSINFGTPNTQLPASNLLSTPAPAANTTLFGNTPQLGQTATTDPSGFQLQNPPLGNKRGKR